MLWCKKCAHFRADPGIFTLFLKKGFRLLFIEGILAYV